MAPPLSTIVIPPLIALALYLLAVYALVPLYRRHRRYVDYIPLPAALPRPAAASGLLARVRARLLEGGKWWRWRRDQAAGLEEEEDGPFVGDEELEEGAFAGRPGMDRHGGARPAAAAGEDGRRLSRDLEGDFLDDSDDEAADPRDRAVAGGGR